MFPAHILYLPAWSASVSVVLADTDTVSNLVFLNVLPEAISNVATGELVPIPTSSLPASTKTYWHYCHFQ